MCIHSHEAAWTSHDSGHNGHYGGLQMSFDFMRDLVPIARTIRSANVLVVNLSVPANKDETGAARAFVAKLRAADPERVKDVEELLELEKKMPAQ